MHRAAPRQAGVAGLSLTRDQSNEAGIRPRDLCDFPDEQFRHRYASYNLSAKGRGQTAILLTDGVAAMNGECPLRVDSGPLPLSPTVVGGRLPLYRGSPGYHEGLDGDSDGIACEPHHRGSSRHSEAIWLTFT